MKKKFCKPIRRIISGVTCASLIAALTTASYADETATTMAASNKYHIPLV